MEKIYLLPSAGNWQKNMFSVEPGKWGPAMEDNLLSLGESAHMDLIIIENYVIVFMVDPQQCFKQS
jgi:hypothetical protein